MLQAANDNKIYSNIYKKQTEDKTHRNKIHTMK